MLKTSGINWWRGGSPVSCRFWPCLASLVLAVLLLQVLHMALLSRLEARRTPGSDSNAPFSFLSRRGLGPSRQLQGRSLETVLAEWDEKIRTAHRLDKSGTYHLLDNFLSSELALRGRAPYDVSLVTQCSASHLGDLWDLAQRWDGPASVAVFTSDADFPAVASHLLHLHFCSEHVFRHVSFHIVYPLRHAPKPELLSSLAGLQLDCRTAAEAISKTTTFSSGSAPVNYADLGDELAYPNNLLRNFAVNYAQTPYVFVVDVDMLPSEGLHAEFQRFMLSRTSSTSAGGIIKETMGAQLVNGSSGQRGKTLTFKADHLSAFVVPVFELKKGATKPSDLSDLLKLWQEGDVRPFYWDVCQKCQEPTSYDRWRALGISQSKKDSSVESKGDRTINVGYSVEYKDPWEPFYIARTSLPLYDERFKQYGFNRISQICEMHMAGFTFHVLDNAFLFHQGFKRPDNFHGTKKAENDKNRLLFRKFKEELKVKYPDVQRRC